jgi:hypothetical protein
MAEDGMGIRRRKLANDAAESDDLIVMTLL